MHGSEIMIQSDWRLQKSYNQTGMSLHAAFTGLRMLFNEIQNELIDFSVSLNILIKKNFNAIIFRQSKI